MVAKSSGSDVEGLGFAIPVDKVKEIIALNKKGQKPKKLEDFAVTQEAHTNTNEGYGEADLKKMSD